MLARFYLFETEFPFLSNDIYFLPKHVQLFLSWAAVKVVAFLNVFELHRDRFEIVHKWLTSNSQFKQTHHSK
jgi:hypothetical protein